MTLQFQGLTGAELYQFNFVLPGRAGDGRCAGERRWWTAFQRRETLLLRGSNFPE